MTYLQSVEQEIARLIDDIIFCGATPPPGQARMGQPTARASFLFWGGHNSLFRVRFCCLLHSVYADVRPPDRSRQSFSPCKEIQQHHLQILHDQAWIAVRVGFFQSTNPERRYHLRGIGLPDDKRNLDDATRFDPGADLQHSRPLHGAWYGGRPEAFAVTSDQRLP